MWLLMIAAAIGIAIEFVSKGTVILPSPISITPAEKFDSPPKISSISYKVRIKGPYDGKKMYIASKAFCNDADIPFEKAKAPLSRGVIMKFGDKESASQFLEKYKLMDYTTELQENT